MNQTTLSCQRETPTPSQDFLLRRFPKWTLAHWCVLLFAASFVVLALLPEAHLQDTDVPNGAETVRVARSLATHGTFANPFVVLPTGTTAHVAPVYPFFYSLILHAFGTGYAALLVAWSLNVAFLALTFALLPVVSHRLQLGVAAGIVAAALGAFSLDAPIDTRWESFFAGLLLLLVYLLTARAFQAERVAATLAAAALWGILVLTNPVAVLLLLAWPLCFRLSQARTSRNSGAKPFALIVFTALLMASPWIVRNYLRFGTFIFVRDNLGLELYTGNNPCAAPDLATNIQSGCHARTHPNPSAPVAAQLAAVGEVAFYRAKLHEALDWIAAHPRAFLRLTAQRIRLFWFPEAERRWESILVWIVTGLSVPGLWLIRRKNSCAACIIGAAWLLFPLVYYLVPAEPRYRYPVYWTSLLPAAYLLTEVFRRFAANRADT